MNETEEREAIRVILGANPVAFTRAYAKARTGDEAAVRWLIEQHEAGNAQATRALEDLAKLQERARETSSNVA